MLRELVRENLETIEGRAPHRLRQRRRRHLLWRGGLLIVASAFLLISFSFRPAAGKAEPREGRAHRRASAVPPVKPAISLAESPAFPAPRPIDPAVFRLGIKRIVIDPGHGGSDPGAETPRGLSEKEITLDVGQRLRDLLAGASFDVAMTREKDESVSLEERVHFANRERGDLFLSIHVNSIPIRQRRGVETYFLGPTEDPRVERLAGAENAGSGYSLADFRRLLEGVYAGVRQDESRRFAEAMQRKLFASLHGANPPLEDRGVKTAPFVVLVGSDMPSILAEVSCVSNEEEARLLAGPDYRQEIARALFAGVQEYAQARRGAAVRLQHRVGG